MKRNLSLLLVSLLFAGTALAQEHNPGSVQPDTIQKSSEKSFRKQRSPRTDHGPVGINISLWKNISTQRTDTIGSTCFNLGVFSSMNRLNGLGMNILGSVTGRDVNGVQMAGLSNMVGGSMRGMQIAGITNINGNNLIGVSVSGLVGITGNHAQGVIISGLANISGDYNRGASIGGLLNISGEGASGIHFAGLANISGGNFKGFSGAGLLSVIGEDLNGMQMSYQHHRRRYDRCSGFRPGQCGGWYSPRITNRRCQYGHTCQRASNRSIQLLQRKIRWFPVGISQCQSPNKSSTDVFRW